MKISIRLSLGFAAMAAILLIVGILAYINLNNLKDNIEVVVKRAYPQTVRLNQIIDIANISAINSRNIILYTDTASMKRYKKIIDDAVITNNANYDSIKVYLDTDEMKATFEKLQTVRKHYGETRNKVVEYGFANKNAEATAALQNEMAPAQEAYIDQITRLKGMFEKQMNQAGESTVSSAGSAITTIIIVIILAIIIAVFISFFITRSITKPINEAVGVADNIAQGNFKIDIDTSRNDETGLLLKSMSTMVDVLGTFIKDVIDLSSSISNGHLDVRAEAVKYKGEYKTLVSGVNGTLDAVIKPLNMTAEYVDRISKGDIPPIITDEYKGDFNEIKNNINMLIDSLNETTRIAVEISKGSLDNDIKPRSKSDNLMISMQEMTNAIRLLVRDANVLSQAAINQQFDTRADVTRHFGEFRNIVAGVNNTLDVVVDKMFWYESIIDSVPFPIHVIDNDMNWVFLNKAFEKLQVEQKNIKDRKDAIGKPCSTAGANICNTENCGIKQLHKGKGETYFDWCGMSCKQDTSYLHNAKGEKIGYIEVVQDLTAMIRNNEYTNKEVTRMAHNLDLLAKGDFAFKMELTEADVHTQESRKKFEVINKSLADVKSAISLLITDFESLSQSALAGNLKQRADVKNHKGDFAKIVDGINKTLDALIAPVNEAVESLKLMAEGDMTHAITGNYKGDLATLKNALNGTLDSINDILSQVRSTVDEVTRGSMQVSDASTALSQGATEQAASLEEITSSMSELGSQTKTNAENANQAKVLVFESKNAAEKGNKEMEQLNNAMKEINDSSKNISKIIKVIDEIAFQTNLLALNAAVEAARAGRHGKGFAVVAEEVRNLAARSATAAKETSDMIENSIKTVETGSILAGRTKESLDEITRSSVRSADIVGEIAVASNEQAQGISQINEGLAQIDKVTQTNTASAEESASAAEELSSQANQLTRVIAKFRLRSQSREYEETTYESFHRQSALKGGQKSKRLAPGGQEGRETAHLNPRDIIKLDEDDFGKY